MATTAYKVLLKDKDGNQLLPRTRKELVEGLQDALDAKQNALTFDTTPTANSSNPVTSSGIKAAIENATANIASSDTVSALQTRVTTAETKLATIDKDADVNQNAFSNVKSGTTTIAAGSATDTLEVAAGSGIAVTPDATNKKITIASNADSALSDTSNNPVQNKVVKSALDGKQDTISDLATIRSNASTGAGLATQVSTNTSDISSLKTSVSSLSGAFQWKGSFDTLPATDGYSAGNVVGVGNKEYVLTVTDGTSAWVEFGDEGSYVAKTTYESKVSELESSISGKVDKETGKGLSTNDYTTAEKTKLSNIAENAQVNVLEGVQVNGTDLTVTDKKVNVDLSDYSKKRTVITLTYAGTSDNKPYYSADKSFAEIKSALDDGEVYFVGTSHNSLGATFPVHSFNSGYVEIRDDLFTDTFGNRHIIIYRAYSSGDIDGKAIFNWEGDEAYQSVLTFDSTPTDGSDNPVTSDGVYDALSAKQDTISDLATIRSNASTGAGLSTQVSTNTSDISTLQSSVNTNASAISTLQSASVFYTQGAEVTALTE